MDEAALHELLSGRRRGIGAGLLRGGLTVASLAYGVAVGIRNFGYQQGWLAAFQIDVPIISLGNITTGGTGKTPMAAWLAHWLSEQGRHPGLLSRGYRSLDGESNDEKKVLDRLCPGVPHVQQRDRVAGARQLVADHQCDALILDDGFQHRRLKRDLDLVLIDALQPWGYGALLPRGLLREPLAGLKRADLIIITRADQATEQQRQELVDRLKSIRGTGDAVQVAFVPRRLIGLEDNSASSADHDLKSLSGQKSIAFCGIGNPQGFSRTVESLTGGPPAKFCVYPDHHHYSASDLANIALAAKEAGADIVLTTMKDLVKIDSQHWQGPPLFAVEIGATILSGADLLEDRLMTVLRVSK